MSFKDYIRTIADMDEPTFNLCQEFISLEEVAKGDFFIKQGQTCRKIAFINSGMFKIFYLKNGNEVNTCFCKESSVISSFDSFINQTPSNEYIQAIEDTEILTLSFESIMKLTKINPDWQKVRNHLTEKECLRLSNRVGSLSFETAKEKYYNLIVNQPEIIKRVSIQDIASYLGVSRETLSRIRSQVSL